MIDLPAPIRRLGREMRLPKSAFLFQSDEAAAAFYFVLSGEVRVFKLDKQGRELEIARLETGNFVGEAFALVRGKYPFFAQASRAARVLAFRTADVERAIIADPAAARFFVSLLARKCVALSRRVESLGMRTVRQRMAEFLLSRCGGEGGCRIDLPMAKGELAKSLGTVGETLSRTLRLMREESLIEVQGKTIRVLKCSGLKACLG
ncbi:MAG: Crp/Fnr family transcriptional regulator [Acidobacteriota bacterium]|nr:Crp/Fnr family transcriptional regulator [Acidobacteriota bacterium]